MPSISSISVACADTAEGYSECGTPRRRDATREDTLVTVAYDLVAGTVAAYRAGRAVARAR